MTESTEARAFEAVLRHPRFEALVALVRGAAERAAASRSLAWEQPVATEVAGGPTVLREEEAVTDFGNVWSVLGRGPKTRDEHALLSALWAHAIAASKPASAGEEGELTARVLWLSAHTPFDATLLLDRVLGNLADAFWSGLGERIQALSAGEMETLGRGEMLTAAAALRFSSSAIAARERARLETQVADPLVSTLLRGLDDEAADLGGELDRGPRHPALTIAFAFTGILFLAAAARVVGRLALAYRRPAHVLITSDSVRVRWRTVVLGRTLREHDVSVSRQALSRVVREVRYARAAFYAGLLALTIGSLVGVRTFVDGVRAASPSLLSFGLIVVAVGVGADFLLGTLGLTRPGRCRVVFVSRDGFSLCVRDVDGQQADKALSRLTRAPVA